MKAKRRKRYEGFKKDNEKEKARRGGMWYLKREWVSERINVKNGRKENRTPVRDEGRANGEEWNK